MTQTSVTIQVNPESVPSTPSWMGEVAAVAQVLTHVGLLKAIQDHVQLARARFGQQSVVVDVDGTRQAVRQRALPQLKALPPPDRRFEQVAAPGYLGRKRGEVVRTRTTFLQTHTHQWMGTFGGAGNGDYRGELKRAIQVINSYATAHKLPVGQILVLDGLYGNAAPLSDVLAAGLGIIARSKDYTLLDLQVVQKRLTQPPDQECTHPESGTARVLYDCPEVPLTPGGPRLRLIVATHPATSSPPSFGVQREGMVYELFVATLPSPAFTPSDVLDLYLHRGSFETVLADEDREQDPDRWCSHTPSGQGIWQVISQWMWNVRLELGQHLSPTAMRTTAFAPACAVLPAPTTEPAPASEPAPTVVYGPRNGPSGRLRVAFQDRLFSFNPMEAYSVPPIMLFMRKNVGRNATVLTACCMRPASVIAADVNCVLMSAEPFHRAPTTGQRRGLASRGPCRVCHHPVSASTGPVFPGALGRLAALSTSAQMDAGGANRVSDPDQR